MTRESHPWMKPLMQFPLSRADLADIVEFLARSEVREIILDNDFPQYSDGDRKLAVAIHRAASGELSGGKAIPVLLACTVNRRSSGNILMLDRLSGPKSIENELERLEGSGVNVFEKYMGITSMILDEDHVLRRTICRDQKNEDQTRISIAVKALKAINEKIPEDLPDQMNIDFVSAPNSELYPVRPLHYLFDPELKKRISRKSNSKKNSDVSLKDAIVIIGDGVTDLYATPYTNMGVNLMSGPELLAQCMDTISRKSWFRRTAGWESFFYHAVYTVFSAGLLALLRMFLYSKAELKDRKLLCSLIDFFACIIILQAGYLAACFLFIQAHLIVPVTVPAVSIVFAWCHI